MDTKTKQILAAALTGLSLAGALGARLALLGRQFESPRIGVGVDRRGGGQAA